MTLPKGYSIKKWIATDRAGKHSQYAAYFGTVPLNKNQSPFFSLKDAQKSIKQHYEYETFKTKMGNKLEESRKLAKKLGMYR